LALFLRLLERNAKMSNTPGGNPLPVFSLDDVWYPPFLEPSVAASLEHEAVLTASKELHDLGDDNDIVACPNVGCKVKILKEDKESGYHNATCPHLLLQCVLCEGYVVAQEMMVHLAISCPTVQVVSHSSFFIAFFVLSHHAIVQDPLEFLARTFYINCRAFFMRLYMLR
jgi:hypothetical protein